jgi:ADP-ribose pyrophosphatase YjhB (NUDIX family)
MPKIFSNFIGVGALVVRDTKYLLVKQGFGEMLNKWVLPGGHLENGESLAHAAMRELQEETGLSGETKGIIAIRSKQIDETTTDVYIVFLVDEEKPAKTAVADGKEILQAAFFSIDALNNDEDVAWLAKEICLKHHQEKYALYKPNSVDGLPYRPFGFYEFYI